MNSVMSSTLLIVVGNVERALATTFTVKDITLIGTVHITTHYCSYLLAAQKQKPTEVLLDSQAIENLIRMM